MKEFLKISTEEWEEMKRKIETIELEINSGLVLTKKDDLEEKIRVCVKRLGIPAHIKGYVLIQEAILMVIKNPEIIRRMTKDLYPSLAQKFNSTISGTERSIRHAIEISWERAEPGLIIELFENSVPIRKCKPTNAHFIATVAEYITIKC